MPRTVYLCDQISKTKAAAVKKIRRELPPYMVIDRLTYVGKVPKGKKFKVYVRKRKK